MVSCPTYKSWTDFTYLSRKFGAERRKDLHPGELPVHGVLSDRSSNAELPVRGGR